MGKVYPQSNNTNKKFNFFFASLFAKRPMVVAHSNIIIVLGLVLYVASVFVCCCFVTVYIYRYGVRSNQSCASGLYHRSKSLMWLVGLYHIMLNEFPAAG